MVQMAVHTPNAVSSGQNTVQHLGDHGVKPRDDAIVDLDPLGIVKTKASVHCTVNMVADTGLPEENHKKCGPGGEVRPAKTVE
jgi:hypothetical protein